MVLAGLQKLTLLDFPGKVACTVFTGGCDLRCPFCQNSGLLTGEGERIPESELLAFLKKRQGILDGVCITGGEPLLQPELPALLRSIRALGFSVKLDTNGTHPDRLEALLAEGLLDYVAMDIKNCPARYSETAGVPVDLAVIARSMALLRGSGIPYEFRTTVVREFHTPADLTDLAGWLRPEEPWFLQQFRPGETVLAPGLHPWEDAEMTGFLQEVKTIHPAAQLRGL
jgi:pyruvate formate lyase activating enzyme